MRRQTVVLIIAVALALWATRAFAQPRADSTTQRRDWLVGVSVGLPGYEREPVPELFTVGVNASQIRPGRLGADFSIGTMPRAIAYGAGVIGARAGVVLPVAPAADVLLLPSAGVSLVGGVAEGGGGAVAGFNAGIAAVLWGDNVGVRTGITWHRFQDFRGGIWLVEFGLVRAK